MAALALIRGPANHVPANEVLLVQVPASVFDPVRVLTANIALELGYALGDHRSALFVSGLLLMTVAVALVAVSHRCGGSGDRA